MPPSRRAIRVESEKGVGSSFIVTVPLKRSDRAVLPEDGMTLPKGLRAVVVDDDSVSCEHVQLVLKAIGCASRVPSSVYTCSPMACTTL